MCLYTFQIKPDVAQEDLIVYKKVILEDNYICGIYVDHIYSKVETAPIRNKKMLSGSDNRKISSGLHAYTKLENPSINTVWIIPKGAKYYISDDGDEIVSNKMIFKETIGKLESVEIKFTKRTLRRWFIKINRWIKADYF